MDHRLTRRLRASHLRRLPGRCRALVAGVVGSIGLTTIACSSGYDKNRSARPLGAASDIASASPLDSSRVQSDLVMVSPSASASASSSGVQPLNTQNPVNSIRESGPFEKPFVGKRTVYYVVPPKPGPARLIANLHGVCNPPAYACGYWVKSAAQHGFLVCPTGDSKCGPEAYLAPTWTKTYSAMGDDLEKSIEAVQEQYPNEILRDGAILTGFSKGAYAAAEIAQKQPGKWPYLILTEATVKLDAAKLRAAQIRSVALIAGEKSSQHGGMKKTVEQLKAAEFRARFWSMPGAGHHYSDNVDDIMNEALDWVLSDSP